MIRYFISDLDGTLFAGHGPTVFDLTKRNQAALKLLKERNICFIPASGRMLSYSLHLLEMFGFQRKIAEAYNGAFIYDNGSFPVQHVLTRSLIYKICCFITSMNYIGVTLQTNDNRRILDKLCGSLYEHYIKESAENGMASLAPFTINDYLAGNDPCLIGKATIRLHTPEDASQLYIKLKEKFGNICYVTISDPTLVEVGDIHSGKQNIIQYLLNHDLASPDEIAVIGDGLNDMPLFLPKVQTFAMNSGNDTLKESANNVVNDVYDAVVSL